MLGEYLSNRKTDGAYLWSNQGEGKYIKVGATFDAYEWGGNTIVFKVDRTLSREFSDPYFLCLDLTTGKTSAQPPIQMFNYKLDTLYRNIYRIINQIAGNIYG